MNLLPYPIAKKSAHRQSHERIITHKLLFFLLSLFVLLAACEQPVEDVDRLEAENKELRHQLEVNVENVEAYFSDLNEIENNLRIIKEREEIIAGETSRDIELGVNQQERINQDIRLIGELMEKNRMLIASLNNRIRNADVRITGFEQMVNRLNHTLEEKEIEVQLLRDQLGRLNLEVDYLTARVDTLEMETRRKQQLLEEQTREMNTAWFAIGSRRELVDNNIISREGGFLGLGKTERLKADFNHDYFTRLDITRDFDITILGEDPRLITSHPENSYTIIREEDEKYLRIEDADRFWTSSRYLVIQVK